MAIVLWSAASTGPRSEAKMGTLQLAGMAEEEATDTNDKQECSELKRDCGEKKNVDLEEKVCHVLFDLTVHRKSLNKKYM